MPAQALSRWLTGAGPHDPARMLAFVGAHAVPGVEVWSGGTYTRTLDLPGGPALASLEASGNGYSVTLRLSDPEDHATALRRLRHLLALDEEVTEAERALADDPLIGPLVAARPGLRAPGSADHAETLLRTIVGQQVSLAGARTLLGRLVAAHGRPLPATWQDGTARPVALWPRPEVVAALPLTDAALAMPAARARAVVAAAGAVVTAGGLPADDELLELPGVGPWTVRYVDLRCRRDPDVFLAGDLAARRALARLGGPTGPREVAAVAARWSPQRSLALLHLWAEYLSL